MELLFKAKALKGSRWIKDSSTYISDEAGVWLEEYSKKRGHEIVRVLRDTVCRFTGAVDIKGINIYEGDVIMLLGFSEEDKTSPTFIEVWEIYFDEERRAFRKREAREDTPFDYNQREIREYRIEVIGNVHDGSKLSDYESLAKHKVMNDYKKKTA